MTCEIAFGVGYSILLERQLHLAERVLEDRYDDL